jgi:endoglycosylceramidase
MLGELAARFAGEEAVVGYDLMNEPNAFTADQQTALADLYGEAVAEIRAREQAAGGFAHLILFEPSALWSAVGRGAPPDFARDRDVVYAPHIYTGGFSNGPITDEAFQNAQDEAAAFGGAPILSGEWGSDPGRAENPDDGYFLSHQRLQDEFRIGATLWTWHESCGDPHKAGDARAGRIPYVWGEFDVDCTNNMIRGVRQALVDQLTRAYVRAAPGKLVVADYDPETGAFAADGADAAPDAELVAFYPAARHGLPTLITSGLTGVEQPAAPNGNVYILARSLGGEWSLRATPSL